MKNIIKQILHFFRRCLEVLSTHAVPQKTLNTKNVSDIYFKKEIEDCFNHFVNEFPNAVLLPG
mgnify:CR=1